MEYYYQMDENMKQDECLLRQHVQQAMADLEATAVSQGLENASIIARRGAVAGSSFHIIQGGNRLMPLAARTLLHTHAQGRDMESGQVWWASSLIGTRGRMERRWWAPKGGIYFCMALFPELEQRLWSLYGIAMGVAQAEVMAEQGVSARIRWINDVLVNNRKVSGTLMETAHTPDSDETWLLIGTGINVNIQAFPPHLDQATSLLVETGRRWPLAKTGGEIIARFGWYLGMLHQWDAENTAEDISKRRENPAVVAWRRLSDSLGRPVIFGRDLEREQGEHGRSLDITQEGRLVVKESNGDLIEFDSGEIRYV